MNIRFASLHQLDLTEQGERVAEYLNADPYGDDEVQEQVPLTDLAFAIHNTYYRSLPFPQRWSVIQVAAQAVSHSTIFSDTKRRAIALEVLRESMDVLTDAERSAEQRNEAALIAERMPGIIALTYPEL